jgi:hypothetical protein
MNEKWYFKVISTLHLKESINIDVDTKFPCPNNLNTPTPPRVSHPPLPPTLMMTMEI